MWKGKGAILKKVELYLKYIEDLVKELSKDYSVQYQSMECFVRWNLPEEIGLEWIDAEEVIKSDILQSVIPEKAYTILLNILANFDDAFDCMDSDIWTHKGMQDNAFWREQRTYAREFISIMNLNCQVYDTE